jgi:hypothetical protein
MGVAGAPVRAHAIVIARFTSAGYQSQVSNNFDCLSAGLKFAYRFLFFGALLESPRKIARSIQLFPFTPRH